ncbi:unnamed protein product, partial [Lactuca virosa]
SIDVSKEDKPILDPPTESVETTKEFNKRILEEKFAVLNAGIFECQSCGYLYKEAAGDPSYPIAPGLSFDKLSDDWRYPTCGAAQTLFQSKSVGDCEVRSESTVWFWGNTLTSGQKAILIYSSLFFFFVLFLSEVNAKYFEFRRGGKTRKNGEEDGVVAGTFYEEGGVVFGY